MGGFLLLPPGVLGGHEPSTLVQRQLSGKEVLVIRQTRDPVIGLVKHIWT